MALSERAVQRAASNFEMLISHYQAALAIARDVDPTGEGVALYEAKVNEYLDDLAVLRGDQP